MVANSSGRDIACPTRSSVGRAHQTVQCLDELQIILDVTSALSSSIDLNRILGVILTGATASQGLGFNRAFLFLYHESLREMRGYAAVGPASAEEAGEIWSNLDSLRLTLAELLDSQQTHNASSHGNLDRRIRDITIDLIAPSAIKSACDTAQVVTLDPTNHSDAVTRSLSAMLGADTFTVAPMHSHSRLTGLLVADNIFTGGFISDRSVRLLQILASQAALAIERTRLYDEQRARADELELNNTLLAESQDHIVRIEKMSIMGRLISSVVHELRNPLTIVGGFANLMLHSAESEEQKEYLGIISGETRRTEIVLDQVLDFCRSSQSDSIHCEIASVVAEAAEMLRKKLGSPLFTVMHNGSCDYLPIRAGSSQIIFALYHIGKVIVDETGASGQLELRAERYNNDAVITLRLASPGQSQSADMARILRQLFGNGNSTMRLPMLVALETIRFYRGECKLMTNLSDVPFVQIVLPLEIILPHEVACD